MRTSFEGTEAISQYWSNQPLGQPIAGTCIAGENVMFDNGRSRAARLPDAVGVVDSDVSGTAGTAGSQPDRIEFAISLAALRAIFAPRSQVLVERDIHVIKKLIALSPSTSAMVIDPRTTLIGAVTVRRVVTMFSIQNVSRQRGTLLAGNVVRFRGEAFFGVGRGALQVDGSLTAVPFTASSTPYVAYPTASGFDFFSAGFDKPAPPTVTGGAGGTKGMVAGFRGFRVAHCRMGFNGRSLLSDASNAATVTIAANGKYTLTAAVLPVGDGTDSIEIYVTKRNDEHRGPWYLYKKLLGVGPHTVDFLDEELGQRATEDDFPPPECLRLVDFGDLLLYVSFIGNLEQASGYEECGAGVAIAKNSNPEAVSPAFIRFVTPAEDIVGVHVGQRYAFLMTPGRLNVGQRLANNVDPLQIFPFGATGFSHQGNGIVIDDVFYGLTSGAIVRTVNGEDMDDEIAFPIKSDIARLKPERSLMAYDAQSQRLVIFENQARLGAGGKWQCLAHSCNLDDVRDGRRTWNTPVVIGDGVTSDCHITGQVTIDDFLYIVAADGQVMAWDKGTSDITGFIATNFAGVGVQRQRDAVKAVSILGGIDGSMRIFRDLKLSALRANGAGGSVTFPLSNSTNESKHYSTWKPNYPGQSFALRWDFTQPGGSLLLESFEVLTLQRQEAQT